MLDYNIDLFSVEFVTFISIEFSKMNYLMGLPLIYTFSSIHITTHHGSWILFFFRLVEELTKVVRIVILDYVEFLLN